MDELIPPTISNYVAALVAEYVGVREVWLVGSRANGRAQIESDWDFLFFANEAFLLMLRAKPQLQRSDVDVLIVVDDNRFESPWPRADNPLKFKRGHLIGRLNSYGEVVGWEWERVSEEEATYTGELYEERAIRFYVPGSDT